MTSTTPPVDRLGLLDQITLDKGAHSSFEEGHCALEVVSWLAGEGFTDAPECASPVLRSYTIALNDRWAADQRQKLVPFLPRMIGTAGDGKDEVRSFMALDWLVRSFTPAWLDLAGLSAEASELRSLRRIVDLAAVKAAGPVLRVAQTKAAAAWDAVGDAAWAAAGDAAGAAVGDAAGDAAGAAAWDAAGDAARDAAGAAARDAAWAAARDAAWAAARAAAGDAARAAAGDAAWDAARDAAWAAAWAAAWDAARAAAGDALKPTVELLQNSALNLLDLMIDGEVA